MNPIETFLHWATLNEAPFFAVILALIGAAVCALIFLAISADLSVAAYKYCTHKFRRNHEDR